MFDKPWEKKTGETIWERNGIKGREVEFYAQANSDMRKIWGLIISIVLITGLSCVVVNMAVGGWGLFAIVEPGVYAIFTSPSGEVRILDEPGIHLRWFCKVYHYPRTMVVDNLVVMATFNDGKVRLIEPAIVLNLPITDRERVDLHIKMAGNALEIRNLANTVVMDVVKATAQLMSTDEFERALRGDFANIVEGQIRQGLYKMKTIYAGFDNVLTEIALDDNGKPVIAGKSILSEYHLELHWFGITDSRMPAKEEKAKEMENIARNMVLKAELDAEVAEQELRRLRAIQSAEVIKRFTGRDPNRYIDNFWTDPIPYRK